MHQRLRGSTFRRLAAAASQHYHLSAVDSGNPRSPHHQRRHQPVHMLVGEAHIGCSPDEPVGLRVWVQGSGVGSWVYTLNYCVV